MAEITAKLVNDLRAKTGLGMMECKKALGECAGDVDKAVEYFRKKGVKTSITERATTEGRAFASAGPDGKTAVALEVRCNTDFSAKVEPVTKALEVGVAELLKNPQADLTQNQQIKELLVSASQQTGENVQLGRTAAITASGKAGAYNHYTGKVAVIVALSGNPSEELIKDLCLHITATRPIAMSREEVPAEIVSKEMEIAVEQAKATGKPQNIAEKIAEGKMRTFYEERVLLDQKFVKDPEKTISALLKSNGATLEKYVRLEIGAQ
ncbi:MAG TPA: translation elongation factor Ts [Tepidisphaeraceae bacterium]|jgi:elongation factor Ts